MTCGGRGRHCRDRRQGAIWRPRLLALRLVCPAKTCSARFRCSFLSSLWFLLIVLAVFVLTSCGVVPGRGCERTACGLLGFRCAHASLRRGVTTAPNRLLWMTGSAAPS